MNLSLIIYAGIITFFTRFVMIALLKKDTLSKESKNILSYVPSAIFPAIIFPAIFLDTSGVLFLESNPKIIAASIAIMIGYFTKNIIATIFSGLLSYWVLIFLFGY
jgi:branched-subunit amino acid transport protein|tara:strand:+ start:696 stop:1013 length:318 start_codon:yes stop_codon:yes gene_type:complete